MATTLSGSISETETVIKRIIPYLRRRGYDPINDICFESQVDSTVRYGKGYVDLLVTCGKTTPKFVIEAKRSGKRLTAADRDQALDYGRATKVSFVVVTNGKDVQCYNVSTKAAIQWNGKLTQKIPTRDQLPNVIKSIKANPDASSIPMGNDDSLPYRPGLPLRQLNELFKTAHKVIRNIEKNEENAFADFSKILFLKLLEEKEDSDPSFSLPYSYRFYELADKPASEADQVMHAVKNMLQSVQGMNYGDVLSDPVSLKSPKTYQTIVKLLANVSFSDSGEDSKGAAFEYFVRATLNGKKLGQYFTPRPLVDLMLGMIGRDAIVNTLLSGQSVHVLDPACGTGGFLVLAMKSTLARIDEMSSSRTISADASRSIAKKVKEEVFFGSDANPGVAATAKMNMVIAGDGHTNIRCENSLTEDAQCWSFDRETCDYIVTNPPFGTSENDTLSSNDQRHYEFGSVKGQYLFLQRMIYATKPGGLIATVIDEGLLNTDIGKELRPWVMQRARLLAVVNLPSVTFKPNKINVRSSVLLLEKRKVVDMDFDDHYPVSFYKLDSLGYDGSNLKVRDFDFDKFKESFESSFLNHTQQVSSGYGWRSFDVPSNSIVESPTKRWDIKYWEPEALALANRLQSAGAQTIKEINLIPTQRGVSPSVSAYVGESDGYALVVKAGSSITSFGELTIPNDADYVEKNVYDEMPAKAKLHKNDVLIACTGDGTLGKACVFDLKIPAIADGHISILRVDTKAIDPYYLADYLRAGDGAQQIERFYTGSTGLIELTPDAVDQLLVILPSLPDQKAFSNALRAAERHYRESQKHSDDQLAKARDDFQHYVGV